MYFFPRLGEFLHGPILGKYFFFAISLQNRVQKGGRGGTGAAIEVLQIDKYITDIYLFFKKLPKLYEECTFIPAKRSRPMRTA